MTTSPSNIRVLHPEYSTDATARILNDDQFHDLETQPESIPNGGDADANTRREQFKVISGQLKRTPIGYTIFVMTIPIVALLVVLVVNIVLSNRQYDLVELNSQLTNITQTNEALVQDLAQSSAPQSVAQQAADLGMVLPGTSASIDLASGKITGTATAAEADNTPTSFVSEPTVRAGTGVPAEVEAPADTDTEPVTMTNEGVPGPESDTVKIVEPQISMPESGVTNSATENGVADANGDSPVGSLQGPQVSLPTGN
ncbi:hypothetical protein [Yaniella halotolerans]|uniref:hypothetical protein n=1 Tax=Yaniella halotolerans TaxID=225453 RepID=UPI0003B5F22E|nr:hypothetical protein [Yaniella halotolerans]